MVPLSQEAMRPAALDAKAAIEASPERHAEARAASEKAAVAMKIGNT
jgi:hypothetical protein